MSKSPDITVGFRRAEENDAELVREIVLAAYSKWISVIGREPTPMKADFNKVVREHDIDLAIVAGDVVGLIEICLHADHLWIENVAVHPHRQGIGIGRRLLSHVESKAAQAEIGEIRLQTNEAFEANIALYAALGYEIDRREPFMGGKTVFMSKKLQRLLTLPRNKDFLNHFKVHSYSDLSAKGSRAALSEERTQRHSDL